MTVIDGLIRFILENPGSAAQIIFSGILAVATIAYTIATFWQISEMKTDREVRNRPMVMPTIANRFGVHHFFAIENTGEGAAYDVTAKWGVGNDEERTWKIPILSPGERRTFPLSFGDVDEKVSTSQKIKEVTDGDSTIDFRACYEDSLGNRYSPDETSDVATASIDVLDTIETREEVSEYVEEDPIKTIADELGNVVDELEDVGRNIDMEHLDERARDEVYQRVLEEVRDEGVVTYEELLNSTGIGLSLLSRLLREMLIAGKVNYDDESAGYFFKDAEDTEIEYVDES